MFANFEGCTIARDVNIFICSVPLFLFKVMEYLDFEVHYFPKTIQGIQDFMRSLLYTFQFAHSRNVMMRDLHSGNVYYDGTMAKLFDWDDAVLFKPNAIKMHYQYAYNKLMPPEAWGDENATHATVSSFDIWSCGILLKKILERRRVVDNHVDNATVSRLNHFLNAMLSKDAYKRPNASELLKYPFLMESGAATR